MSKERKKLILALAVIFAVNIFIIALAQNAWAELYKKGSSGAPVTEIQTRLKNWGYYSGEVDGVYGSATEKAVRYFQEKNGLAFLDNHPKQLFLYHDFEYILHIGRQLLPHQIQNLH